MLALETGWTPDVLADLPVRFRAECHWALYARSLAGPEGFPSTEIPQGASQEQRLAVQRARAQLGGLRSILYPEDDDGDA